MDALDRLLIADTKREQARTRRTEPTPAAPTPAPARRVVSLDTTTPEPDADYRRAPRMRHLMRRP